VRRPVRPGVDLVRGNQRGSTGKAKGSLPASPWVIAVAVVSVALAGLAPALPGLWGVPSAQPQGSLTGPGTSAPVGGPPGTVFPLLFLRGPLGGILENSLFPDAYAGLPAGNWTDSYLLQVPPPPASPQVSLEVTNPANDSVLLRSASLYAVSNGSQDYALGNGSGFVRVGSTLAPTSVWLVQSGGLWNETANVSSPHEDGTPASGPYLEAENGTILTAYFPRVKAGPTPVLLLRLAGDPTWRPENRSGISIRELSLASGQFVPVGFISPRESWATFAVAIPPPEGGTNGSLTFQFVWQGTHAISWIALGLEATSIAPEVLPLITAISSTGANWTSELLPGSPDRVVLLPGAAVNLTYSNLGNLSTSDAYGLQVTGELLEGVVGPRVTFQYTPREPASGVPVEFVSNASDAESPLVRWTWDFGDGTGGTGPSVNHTYDQPGTVRVTLTVADAEGLVDSSSEVVQVVPGISLGAHYVIQVGLRMAGTPGNNLSIEIIPSPGGRPVNLSATRTPGSPSNGANGTLVLPARSGGEKNFSLVAYVGFHGRRGSTPFWITLGSPLLTLSVPGHFVVAQGGQDQNQTWNLTSDAWWVLAGGLLVQFQGSSPGTPLRAPVHWNFSGPVGPIPGPCTNDDLLCYLEQEAGTPPLSVVEGLWSNVSCLLENVSLAGNLSCSSVGGNPVTHLFVVPALYRVTATVFEGGQEVQASEEWSANLLDLS